MVACGALEVYKFWVNSLGGVVSFKRFLKVSSKGF